MKHHVFSIDSDIVYTIFWYCTIPWIQLNMTALLHPIAQIKQNKYDSEYNKSNVVELFSIHSKLKCDEKHYSKLKHCCKHEA